MHLNSKVRDNNGSKKNSRWVVYLGGNCSEQLPGPQHNNESSIPREANNSNHVYNNNSAIVVDDDNSSWSDR